MWGQQLYAPDAAEAVHWRKATDTPPAALWIHSPYDMDVRYGFKRNTAWVGYKVHLTETCDPESVHLITQVQTTPALDGDVTQVAPIQRELQAKGLAPKTQLVDTGYTSAEELVTSRTERGIELLGPLRSDNGWQALERTGYDQAAFAVDWEQHRVTCPQGKQSQQWKPGRDPCGRPNIQVKFARADCQGCAARELCTRSKTSGRALSIRLRPEQEALQRARATQQTAEFKERLAPWAGVEGTMSQGVRAFELRQSRYSGEEKTHLQHIWIALAINVVRLVAWWHGEQPAQTRVSHFAALAPCIT
jgi:transposase